MAVAFPSAAVRGLVVVHVDALVGLVIVGRHGEGGLVRVDALAAAAASAVLVAGEVAVELVVLECVAANQRGSSK